MSMSLMARAVFLLTFLGGLLAARVQRWERWPDWVREINVRWPCLVDAWALWTGFWRSRLRCLPFAPNISMASPVAARVFFLGQGIGLLRPHSRRPGKRRRILALQARCLWRTGTRRAGGYIAPSIIFPWAAATCSSLPDLCICRYVAGPARLFVALITALSGLDHSPQFCDPGARRTPQDPRENPAAASWRPLTSLRRSLPDSSCSSCPGPMKGYRDATTGTTWAPAAGWNHRERAQGVGSYEEAIVLS